MKLDRPLIELVDTDYKTTTFLTTDSETFTNFYELMDFGNRPIFYRSVDTMPDFMNFDKKTTIRIVNTEDIVDKLLNNFISKGSLLEYTVNSEKDRLSEDPDLEIRFVVSKEQEHDEKLMKRLKDSEVNFLRSIASGKCDFGSSFKIYLPHTSLRCEIIITADNDVWRNMIKNSYYSYSYYLGNDYKKAVDDLVSFIKEKI